MKNNKPETREITHYFPRIPYEKGWIYMAFITRKDGKYYIGFEEIEIPEQESYIRNQLALRHIKGLPQPQIVSLDSNRHLDKCLWLNPLGEVYIADQDDPIGDQGKTLVDKIQNPNYFYTSDHVAQDLVLLAKQPNRK